MKQLRFHWCWPGSLLAFLLIAGCGRTESNDAGKVPAHALPQPGNPAIPAGTLPAKVTAETITPSGPDSAPMLAQLTQVLRKFSVERRQVPKSLDELVAAGYLKSIPPAPSGKQFMIDAKRLEVVLQGR